MSETDTWLEANLIMPAARVANWALEDLPSVTRGLNSWSNFVQENKNELSETIDEYSEETKNFLENNIIIPAAMTMNSLLVEHPAVTRWFYGYQHACNAFVDNAPENILSFAIDSFKLPAQVVLGLITLMLSINCQSFELQEEALDGFDVYKKDNATEVVFEVKADQLIQHETYTQDSSDTAFYDELSVDLQDVHQEYFVDVVEEVDMAHEDNVPFTKLTLAPDNIKFGILGVGCTSPAKTICIQNDSADVATISEISTSSCNDVFLFENIPDAPFVLAAGAVACFDITYSPIVNGDDFCQIAIVGQNESNYEVHAKLQGSGTLDSENVDAFEVSNPYVESYQLSAKADDAENKIRVAVDSGKGFFECVGGWLYDNDTNSILFMNDGNCLIQQGCKIRVWYELECKAAVNENVHITVAPQSLNFSQTTVGCYSKPMTICAINDGAVPISISDISLSPEAAEFQLANVPPLPVFVLAGAQRCFSALYSPYNEGSDGSAIVVETNQVGNISIPVIGEGTWETERTEYFVSANSDTEIFPMSNNVDPISIKVWIDNGSGYQQCLSGWMYDQQNNGLLFAGDGTCLKSVGASIKVWSKILCFTN